MADLFVSYASEDREAAQNWLSVFSYTPDGELTRWARTSDPFAFAYLSAEFRHSVGIARAVFIA
jgi:hypothetical protein